MKWKDADNALLVVAHGRAHVKAPFGGRAAGARGERALRVVEMSSIMSYRS